MSEVKHTSGPWIWHEGTPHITRNWAGHVAVVASVDFDLPWHEDRNSEGREQGANARLIAASPALYDAAEMALNTLIACCVPAGGVDDRKTMLEAQEKLRAAIQLAKESS